jgi:hypothetical protein
MPVLVINTEALRVAFADAVSAGRRCLAFGFPAARRGADLAEAR